MNKYLFSLISILSIIVCILFFMYKNQLKETNQLKNDYNTVNIQLINLQEYNKQKDIEIQKQQIKYNKLISEYKGTDCENQPVSEELVNLLRGMRND